MALFWCQFTREFLYLTRFPFVGSGIRIHKLMRSTTVYDLAVPLGHFMAVLLPVPTPLSCSFERAVWYDAPRLEIVVKLGFCFV